MTPEQAPKPNELWMDESWWLVSDTGHILCGLEQGNGFDTKYIRSDRVELMVKLAKYEGLLYYNMPRNQGELGDMMKEIQQLREQLQ